MSKSPKTLLSNNKNVANLNIEK